MVSALYKNGVFSGLPEKYATESAPGERVSAVWGAICSLQLHPTRAVAREEREDVHQ